MRLRSAARREQESEPEPDPMASRSLKRAELLTAATGSGKSPRVALEQQVLSQVPPRAVRYRLVLGVEQQFHNAVVAPENSAWNLMPFEAPDDLRLLPGHTYRIVWIDRSGKPVRPIEWAPVPSLHFFLGEPDAEISAQQVESRYQTQTLMQLRQQVQQLEQQLARAKRKQRAQKRMMRDWKRRARDKIATLKLLHREDSFKTVIGKWAPVLGIALGLRWLATSKPSADRAASAQGAAQTDSPNQDHYERLEILPAMARIHPLRHSFVMLSDLIESDDSIPTDRELARMSTRKIWSRMASWLEKAKLAHPSQDVPSISLEWQAFQRVSEAASALAFMSQALQDGETGEKLSDCGRGLLRASERIDERLRSWLGQHDLAVPLDQTARAELVLFSDDLANILRDSPPQLGDAFGQLLHDALNAIRIRLLGAIGLPLAASQSSEQEAPLDLRSLALAHGPQVLMRCVKQLLEERANLRDLSAQEPRRAAPPAESENETRIDESKESDLHHATHRGDEAGKRKSDTVQQDDAPVETASTETKSFQSRTASTAPVAPAQSTDAHPRNKVQASSAASAASANRIPPRDPVLSEPAGADEPPETGRSVASAQPDIQHEYPTLPPDELMRQLATSLAEHPSWVETFASALIGGGGLTETSTGVVESLDPALRAELLNAVHAALQVPKSGTGPN